MCSVIGKITRMDQNVSIRDGRKVFIISLTMGVTNTHNSSLAIFLWLGWVGPLY